MKRSIAVTLLLPLIVFITSCKKSAHPSPAIQNALYMPWDMDSIFSTYATAADNIPLFYNVAGILVASKVSGVLTDTSGQINIYNRTWEYAAFTSLASTSFVGAGSVSINSISLIPTTSAIAPQYYIHYDSSSLWNDSAINNWSVSGSDTIPAFTATVDGTFPSFTGTLPTNISRSSDFSFTFNTSNTINGDSAYVLIYFDGAFYTSNVVSTHGGNATINASKMAYTSNQFTPLSWFYPMDQTIYYGGFINIVIYNHTIQTFGGKQFAFVKQREVLGVVNFL